MKTIGVQAFSRALSGKGPSRRLRNEGYTPAIFYGYGVEPISISIESAGFLKQLAGEKAEGTFVKLKISDESGAVSEKLSVVKQLQVDTLKKRLVHADFYEIKMDRELTVDLQVHFIGTPRGVEEDGGDVQLLKRQVTVSGLPGSLPEIIELDITNLGIGDTLMVGDLSLGEDVRIHDAEEVALVTVSAMRVAAEEEAEEEAGEEGAEVEESEEPKDEAAE